MDIYAECRMRLLAMGYSEPDVDDVLARMRDEEEAERGESPQKDGRSKPPQPQNLKIIDES